MKRLALAAVILSLGGCVSRARYMSEMGMAAEVLAAQAKLDDAMTKRILDYERRLRILENHDAEYREKQSERYK